MSSSYDMAVISQPVLGDVFRLLEQKSHDWRKIGRGLNVKYDFCQNLLEQGVMTSNEDKLKAVLNNWIETRCSEVSWDNLIEVLTDLELNDVVYDVRSFLRTETGSGPTHTPQLRDVYILLKPRSYEWPMIGEYLGVDLSFRESLIRDGVQRTNEEILEAVLNYWIETQCSEVSWDKLIQVLTELGFSNTAQDVRRFLQIDTVLNDYTEAFKKAVREKGSLSCYIVQCMPFGPPRVGKTCLYHRLLDKKLPGKKTTHSELGSGSESTTALAERKTIQVEVDPRSKDRPARAIVTTGKKWNEVSTLKDETAIYIKSIGKLPPGESRPVNNPITSLAIPTPIVKTEKRNELDDVVIDAITRDVTTKVDMTKVQSLLDSSMTIFYTDTGGQPEFHEVLPALVAGPSVFLMVFNLHEGFDSMYKVRYNTASNTYNVYNSSFTVRHVLMQCLSSIASYHKTCCIQQNTPVKVMVFGTHSDLVTDETIAITDKELRHSIDDTIFEKEDLVEPLDDEMLLVPLDNYNYEHGDKVREIIERVIKREEGGASPYQVEFPVPWLGLELSLRRLGSSTISYNECFAYAKKFSITEEEFPSCLNFLHYKTGTIRYYSSVEKLKDTVIIKPDILFIALTELITSTFNTANLGGAKSKTFKTLGLFKADDAKGVFKKHEAKLGMHFDQFLALLQYLNILGEAHGLNTDNETFDYFLPCALVHAPEPESPHSVDLNSLLVAFESGFVPKGVFSGLLCFLSNKKFKILRDHNRRPKLFRNQATFEFNEEDFSVTVTMKVTAQHLELSITFNSGDNEDPPHTAYSRLRHILEEGMRCVCRTLRYIVRWKFGLYCTHPECKNEKPHFAEVTCKGTKCECSITCRSYPLTDEKNVSSIQSLIVGIPNTTHEDIEVAKQKIGRIYSQANHPRGIAFVVGILDPDGTRKDIREMESAFEEEPLKFAVFHVSDPSCAELAALLIATAEYEYPITCKFIVFYFAGHGGTDDKGREFVIPRKLKGDSDILMIDHNILGPFRSRYDDPIPLKSGERRPCLFFFDCCLSQADIVHTSKNFFLLQNPPRHSIIAYATSPGLKSQGNKTEGGLWTKYLSRNLRKENEPLTKILTDTHRNVSNELKDRQKKFKQKYGKAHLDVLENLTKLARENEYEILDEELTKLRRERNVSKEFVNSFLSAYVPQVPHFLDSSFYAIFLNKQTNKNKQLDNNNRFLLIMSLSILLISLILYLFI